MIKRKTFIKGIIAMTTFSMLLQTTVFAEGLTKSQFDSKQKEVQAKFNERLKDPKFKDKLEEVKAEKKDLIAEQNKVNKELGISEFWNSFSPDEAKDYYIHDDGSVTLRDIDKLKLDSSSLITKQAEVKGFEKKFKAYINGLNQYNKKNGVAGTVLATDGKGNIAIGDSNGGSGPYTTVVTITSCMKGDVMTGNDTSRVSYQGVVEHAGIYDGTGSWSDYCILSTDGPGKTTGFDHVSGWAKEYNSIYAWNVWATSAAEASNAYQGAFNDSWGDPYAWNTPLFTTDAWYCSKIPYWGYDYYEAVDIDGDGGYWCLPQDIQISLNTTQRAHWTKQS